MGRYISWDSVANRYSDAAHAGGAADVGSSFIAGAEAEVEARLAARYTVPFSSTPPLVADVCIDLAYVRMTARQKESEPIYERAMALLKDMVNGTIPLVDASGVLLDQGSATRTFASNSYRSAFGPDDPLNWSPSQSAIDDAQDTRDYD